MLRFSDLKVLHITCALNHCKNEYWSLSTYNSYSSDLSSVFFYVCNQFGAPCSHFSNYCDKITSIVHRCLQRWREWHTAIQEYNFLLYSLWIVCASFNMPHKCCEMESMVCCSWRRLESLTMHLQMSIYKDNTFTSVKGPECWSGRHLNPQPATQ